MQRDLKPIRRVPYRVAGAWCSAPLTLAMWNRIETGHVSRPDGSD